MIRLLTIGMGAGWLCLSFAARAGVLTGDRAEIPQGADANLTEAGTIDWVHWGLFTETSVNRKAGVVAQISDYSVVYSSNGYAYAYQYADNFNTYSWADGTPEAIVTNTPAGVWVYGIPQINSGFRITTPADIQVRTLSVYVGAYAARGRLRASLSDGSAPDYSDMGVFNMRNGPSEVYTLNFAADSPGQVLTVTYTLAQPMAADGNVTLQGAALHIEGGNNPPIATLTQPSQGTNYPAFSEITLEATASDTDGIVAGVEFFADNQSLGVDSEGPAYTATWADLQPGRYSLAAVATDDQGAQTTSPAVEVFVFGSGGSLVGMTNFPPPRVDLTSEGVTDWIHWGYDTNALVNRKRGVPAQISPLSLIGTNALELYQDNYTAYRWSDGTPTLEAAGIQHGVFIKGVTNGFQLSAPADDTPRRLSVYVGLYGAASRLRAYLSDYSTAAYNDQSLSNVFGNSYAVYILDYQAASPGQSLIVEYQSERLFDQNFGNVTIQAAALIGEIPKMPVMLFDPRRVDGQFLFSFLSEAGQDYTVQFTPQLGAMPWSDGPALSGTGQVLTVTNDTAVGLEGVYRIRTD